ncbi:MAG: phospholipid carrier-dependent glycosyltransferase [Armatimonadota bacterium]
MSAKFARISLVILMVTHFCLAAWFAMITPYRTGGILQTQGDGKGGRQHVSDVGAPDERQHANYIRHLLTKNSLPILKPGSPDLGEEYQSHQPPLYYSVAKIVAEATGKTDVETSEFGRTIRLLNCFIGTIGVAGVFFAGLWGSKREEIGTLAASVASLLPMNVALSGAISNDPLLFTFMSWSVAFLLKAWTTTDDPDQATSALQKCAFLVGFALCTKTSALIVLIPHILVALWFLLNSVGLPTDTPRQMTLRKVHVAFLAILPILLVVRFWLRNQNLYGDPLAQKVFREAFPGSAQKSLMISIIEAGPGAGSSEVQYWINWIGYWTARSFIGVFGYMDIWFNESGNPYGKSPDLLYKAIILFNFLGLGGGVLWLRKNWNENKRLGAITLGLIGLTLALFVMFNNTYFQAQARYLFPALSAFATLMAIGWVHVFRKWQIALALVVIIFGGFTVYAGTQLPGEFAKRIQTESPSP